MFTPSDLFDLGQTEHASLFAGCPNAWEALPKLNSYILAYLDQMQTANKAAGVMADRAVFIGEGVVIEEGVLIKGPAIIGRNCHIRHNAYIRENVILGDNCVLGNSSELKNALLFNNAQLPHFNYAGDSVLGYKAHLGAGVKVSNVKLVPGSVMVEWEGNRIDTGLRKFGALIGDGVDVGCNAVLNPGTVLGRGAVVYPNVCWRGVLPPNHIAKNKAAIQVEARKTRKS